jgi:tetratricopeptide (TPR) repeat protein
LEGYERVLGADNPDTLTSVNNLGYLLQAKGDLAAAEHFYRRALESRERVLEAENPDTLTSVNNLGGLLLVKGDMAGAEPLYRRALESLERLLGADNPDIAVTFEFHASLLRKMERRDEAELFESRARAIRAKSA